MPRRLNQSKKSPRKKRSAIFRITWLAVIIMVLTGVVGWWRLVQSDPERVFWGAIDNALKTSNFSRQTIQNDGSQVFAQRVNVVTSPTQVAAGSNHISQEGNGGYDVLTNVIGTPSEDFVRYMNIQTAPGEAGKPIDYSSIIGLWGKASTIDNQTSAQLYNQSVLGVLPFGNLSLVQRRELVNLIRQNNVYSPDLNGVKKTVHNHRPVYTYKVTMKAEPYILMLKKYARLVGMNQLEQTNPSDFKDTPDLAFEFDVDVWTHRVKRITYEASGQIENYAGFGARAEQATLPDQTITVDELQAKIQAAQ